MSFLVQVEGHTLWAPALKPPFVVLDLGANQGNFSHGILKRFACQCVAVEANPQMCALIPPHANLQVHQLAVAAQTGKLTLHLSTNPEASTILPTGGIDLYQSIEVDAVRLDDFRTRVGLTQIDLIKFDIEGAEIEVLDSCSDEFLTSIGQLTVEFHDFLGMTPVATVERVVARLESLGFYTLKMWRHAWGDTLFVNTRLPSATGWKLAWSRRVTRNCWGAARMLQRVGSGK